MLYHGRNDVGGWTLGVCTPAGEVLHEFVMPGARHYGHVSTMQGRAALLLDGNVSDNLLTWLYFDGELPRVEVIAAHNTQWNSLPGQTTHPHTPVLARRALDLLQHDAEGPQRRSGRSSLTAKA